MCQFWLIYLKQRILSYAQQNYLLLVQGIGFLLLPYQDEGWRKEPEGGEDKKKKKQTKCDA